MERLYCTLGELLDDLEENGVRDPESALRHIRAASQWIERHFDGNFIPITATRRFDGLGGTELEVSPLLVVTSITDDTTTLSATDYLLYPRNKLWVNGPYIRIVIDPDATSLATWTIEKDIVAVAGRWGLYEDTESTGATGTLADASDTGLLANYGDKIRPGAVLKIEDEQVLVEGYEDPVDSTTDVNEALDSSEEVVTVDNGALFNSGEIIRVDFEQMLILEIRTHDLYVIRGYNGTQKTTHADDASVYVYRDFTVKRGVNGTTAAAHDAKAVSRYLPPDDINWLCRQIAGLMWKKAQSGYAGKSGNADLGEVYYYQEFPKTAIQQIEWNYFIPAV